MIYHMIADKRYKCSRCKNSIWKDEPMIVERIGRTRAKRLHEICPDPDRVAMIQDMLENGELEEVARIDAE